MRDANELVGVVFSGLSALVVEGVTGEGEIIRVSARTRDDPVLCPACGQPTRRVHGFHGRVVADVPVDGRRVVVSVRVRRLACPVLGCPRQTFREQVPGVVERYQRRTNRLASQLGSVVAELAGRAGARLSRVLACGISRSTSLRMLMCQAVTPLRVPRVLGIDDFALKRRHRYATVIIDAETGERIDVLPDRTAQTLTTWLREHPGSQYVCRDGSATYADAIRQALPEAVQVSDRWHLWSNLCGRVLAEVRSHAACWATAVNPTRPGGVREQTTRERWQRVHHLLDQGVGLLECARRLNVALNTVKRYARMKEPTGDRRVPRYKPTRVDPYRDHLRRRRAEDPAVPVTHLLREIKKLGYTGSANLLVRYLTQGRAEGDKPVTTPQRFARLLLTRPENLRDKDTALLRELAAACLEMTELARLTGEFAQLLTPAEGNNAKLADWITPTPRRGPAPPAILHERPRTRPSRRRRRPHSPLPQRPHRGRQHPNQTNHETNARPSRIPATPPPHSPPVITTRRYHRLRARAARLTDPAPARDIAGDVHPYAAGELRSYADTCPTERSPRRQSPTISALNSGVNERRGRRGFFLPMLSMMDILSGLNP